MKTNEEWSLFERLSDPSLSEEERRKLETLAASDPALAARFETFQALSSWPKLEPLPQEASARARVMRRYLEETASVERDLGRLFPAFIGGAVAAALLVALLNVWQFEGLSSGPLEALFGLPAESIETVMVSQL